jgi:hypothetical protein
METDAAIRRPWPGLRPSAAIQGSAGAAKALPAPPCPDWKDGTAYAPLVRLERSAFAWEWLRRRRDFCQAAFEALAGATGAAATLNSAAEEPAALRWGLHLFEDPSLSAGDARPIWTAARHSWVVAAQAEDGSDDADAFSLDRLAPFARVVVKPRCQHLLLSDGCRSVRLDVTGASLQSGPVRLVFELVGLASFDRPRRVLQRLRLLAKDGHFSPSRDGRFQRAQRMVALLRTFDALEAGATQAEIAEAILANRLERGHWRLHSPNIRSRAQRLVRAARTMAAGAFWNLLW